MKKYKILVSLLALLISSCLSAQDKTDSLIFKTAIEYNNYIIDEQIKVTDEMNKLTVAINYNRINEFDIIYKAVLDSSKSACNNIMKIEPYNGNREFRDAAKDLFGFYCRTTKNKTSIFIRILKKQANISSCDQRKVNRLNARIEKKEKELVEAFGLAQQKFAKENNFTIAK